MRKPVTVDCETVQIESKEARMFPIGKQEGWVSWMVTGKHESARALKRCRIFKTLMDQVRFNAVSSEALGVAVDPKMALMRFDDDVEVPKIRRIRGRKREVEEITGEVCSSVTSRRVRCGESISPAKVRMPQHASSKEERDVWVMVQKNRLWMDEDSTAWFVLWVKGEVDSGGVDPVEHDDEPTAGIWDFRDDSWVAQHVGEVDGKTTSRRGPIMKRMRTAGDPCFGLTKEDAKTVVFKELHAWLNERT